MTTTSSDITVVPGTATPLSSRMYAPGPPIFSESYIDGILGIPIKRVDTVRDWDFNVLRLSSDVDDPGFDELNEGWVIRTERPVIAP